MSKSVLIVEKDLALIKSIREGLKGRGFTVDETTDGKGVPDLVRKKKPDLVVLAVDLDAGQNGYIICKKLKSDAEVKAVPVMIIGDPKGFESHQKLKTRAEDYLGKPFEAATLVDRVGALLGVPSEKLDEGFEPVALLGDEAEEISIDSSPNHSAMKDAPVDPGDPDFEMVDSMFEDKPPPPTELTDEARAATNPFDDAGEKTVVAFSPLSSPRRGPSPGFQAAPPFQSTPSTSGLDGTEGRELRSKLAELTAALDEARAHSTEVEGRVRELESQLETQQTELETLRSAPKGGESKEVFALRDAANKKDKEVLRLKNELNAKEQEIVELREKENALEQQASDASGEMAKKDAQLKTLQAKADQLATERKKVDQQLLSAREEARSNAARLSTLQGDFDALQARASELEAQLEPMRAAQADAESARGQAEAELSEARGEIDALRSQLDERSKEADESRAGLESTQMELDQARSQLAKQSSSFADEIAGLRQRLADAEAETRKHEERSGRHQARVKAQQDHLERLRIGLQQTLQTLEDGVNEGDAMELDELAEA